ncbi:hypothetical protein BC629DRAFT_1542810 [Irpex lacteus]|nr:hypothetical protein BC629DRAFT_1542810 [Irpex lacteus]
MVTVLASGFFDAVRPRRKHLNTYTTGTSMSVACLFPSLFCPVCGFVSQSSIPRPRLYQILSQCLYLTRGSVLVLAHIYLGKQRAWNLGRRKAR